MGVVVLQLEYLEDSDEWTAALLLQQGGAVVTPEPCEDLPTALEFLSVAIATAVLGD